MSETVPSMKLNSQGDGGRDHLCGSWCALEAVELGIRAGTGCLKKSKQDANDVSEISASMGFPEASTRYCIMNPRICGGISVDKMKLASTGLDETCKSSTTSFNKQKA